MNRLWIHIVCVCVLGGGVFARSPAVYLSFDESEPAQWTNRGVLATGEQPFRTGDADGPTAASAEGVAGRAFDGRALISMQPANVPVWGSDLPGLPKTEIEGLFEGARSFTVTAWIKTESMQPQGRLIKTPAFQINYRGDRLETGFARPQRWYGSEVSVDRFGSVGEWRFVAVTWQGGQTDGEVRYYTGTKTSEVTPAGDAMTDWILLSGDETGCWLTIGNSESDGNRPFVGLIDEVRMWAATDQSAVLQRDELERIRRADLESE